MKKRFLSMLLVASCFGVANAQLIVDENGKVGIGVEDDVELNSSLNVNTAGASYTAVHINPNNTTQRTGLYVGRTGLTPSDGYQVAGHFQIQRVAANKLSIGLLSRATSSTLANVGRSFGIMAYAGNATHGYNYGVFGVLSGTANGAGVYGSTNSEENGTDTGGRYAGFFNGDVHTTGTLTAKEYTTLSDYRVKRNIQSVTANNSPLDNLMGMNVVEYNYIDVEAAIAASEVSDTLQTTRRALSEEAKKELDEIHYGLIAQELQTIYPNLVKEGRSGYLTINYIEIIPLLISSIQELKTEIDMLKGDSSPVKKSASRSAENEDTDIDAVVNTLYQNEPNPFTVSTVIRCDVADEVAKADLYIYTMNGEQIAEYTVAERGETSVTIDGGSLNAGMYLYALVADGKVIDTKRMILTK
ncbi:MAG: tail fiber domain-containing protein [Bacteroidaceae bacterium]|nr:tail fiber domain-containing protein [Bacteroidaceae bacterium]